jgi:hypothetical protein
VFDLPTSKPRYWFVQNQGVLVCSKPRYWFVQNRLHTYMVCSYAYSQTGPKNVTELQGCPSFLGPSKICLYTFLHICTYIRYIKYMHRYNKRVSLFTLKRQVWNCHTLCAHYLLYHIHAGSEFKANTYVEVHTLWICWSKSLEPTSGNCVKSSHVGQLLYV